MTYHHIRTPAQHLTLAAATTTDPLRSTAALRELLRQSEAEVERLNRGICTLLAYAGRHDGKVPGPMLRRLLVWEENHA